MKLRATTVILLVGFFGCTQRAKVGTGKPGEFSREAVEKAAFMDGGAPEAPKEEGQPTAKVASGVLRRSMQPQPTEKAAKKQ